VVDPKLLLELLVGVFTDLPSLARGSERLGGGIGRQVRHSIFAPRSTALAGDPNLVARHALHTVIEHPVTTIRKADTAGREVTCQTDLWCRVAS
jgi:hypothetical protein